MRRWSGVPLSETSLIRTPPVAAAAAAEGKAGKGRRTEEVHRSAMATAAADAIADGRRCLISISLALSLLFLAPSADILLVWIEY